MAFACCTCMWAQVVTTSPAFITKDYTGEIIITFDPSQGNQGMVGATSCYAHTGACTATKDWQCAPTWRDGSSRTRLTQVGTKWQLTINNMYEYYNCLQSGEEITRLAFVFNDGPNGSKEGKTVDGGDIFIDLYDAGLNVKMNTPTGSQLLETGDRLYFSATASTTSQLLLRINEDTIMTTTGTTIASFHLFEADGNYQCIVEAHANEQIDADTIQVCVIGTNNTRPRPAGTQEGINYDATDPSKATLVMYAKDKAGVKADQVLLLGDFNNWTYKTQYKLNNDTQDGYFWITLSNLVPGKEYAFQYVVKQGSKLTLISDAYAEKVLDPWNDSYLDDIYPGLSYPASGSDGVVSVLQPGKSTYAWSDATLNFQQPDKNNLVIYELWIYDFTAERTIKAVTQRLDYLQNMGVNAIELMPITEFDGNISWGYNPNHFFASDKAYGTENDYKNFIDECHRRGIAVIVDMVFNHASGTHPWAKLYWNSTDNKTASNNPWFNVDAPHPYSVFHDFNHEYEGTKNYFNRVLQYWLTEYKVDGFRMDLTKGFTNQSSNESTASNYDQSRIDILKGYYLAAKQANDDVIFIIEHFCTSSEEQVLVDAGLIPWNNLNNAFCQTAMGWLRDGDALSGMNKKGWVSFGESHDEERNFYKAKTWGNGNLQTDSVARINRVPLNTAFGLLQPGAKMIWQFGELAYDYNIEYNGRTGTKPVPETMGWYNYDVRMNAYQKVGQMAQLRTKQLNDLFLNGTFTSQVGTEQSVRYLRWNYNNENIVVVGNFNVNGGSEYTGNATATPFTSLGTWYEYFSEETIQVTDVAQTISLQPGEIRIYSTQKYDLPTVPNTFNFADALQQTSLNVECSVYPTLTNDLIYIDSTEPIRKVQIYNLRGQQVLQLNQNVSQVNMSELNKGLYLLILTFDKTQQGYKVIKQ